MVIRKTTLMNYLRSFSAIISISNKFILHNGIFVGVEKSDGNGELKYTSSINGVHVIKTLFNPCYDEEYNDTTYISSPDIAEQVKTIKELKNVGAIQIIFDKIGVHIIYGDDSSAIAEQKITLMTRCLNSIDPNVPYYYDILDKYGDRFISMDRQHMLDMRSGKIVVLCEDDVKVRVSKTQLPLLGPVRASSPLNFNIEYCINSDTNVLIMSVHYQYFEAIHVYAFQNF